MIRQRKLTLTAWIGIALMLVCSGCGGGGTHGPTYKVPDAELPITGPTVAGEERLNANVTALLKKWNVPGAAVAIAKDGKLILAKGYGFADLEAGRAMQPDAMFRIGSTSKMLTSIAVQQLVEQGKLGLDAKFVDVLPEYGAYVTGDARLRVITIRMLLQHSGGWDRTLSGDPINKQVEIAKALGVASPASCPDLIRYMMGKPLDFNPGTKWAYSNFGYCILGRVVEKASGEQYETYVRKHILEPAGMQGMYIGTTRQGRQGPYEVKYYDHPGAPLVDSVFPGEGKVPVQYGGYEIEGSYGGWIGSPVDLVRLMTALDGSRATNPISAASLAQMLANPGLSGIGPGIWYGFGVFVGPSPDRWCHGGSLVGGQTQLCRDSNGYTYAIISNSRTDNPDGFSPEEDAAVTDAISTGLVGSSTDLFPQYPSPAPPTKNWRAAGVVAK